MTANIKYIFNEHHNDVTRIRIRISLGIKYGAALEAITALRGNKCE